MLVTVDQLEKELLVEARCRVYFLDEVFTPLCCFPSDGGAQCLTSSVFRLLECMGLRWSPCILPFV